MEGINKIFCGSDVKNTGVCECFFDPKLITGAIFVPKGLVLPNSALTDADIATTMANLISAAKASRIFPFPSFVNITPNTEDPTRQTFGYGSIATVREGNYDWLLQFRQGGVNASNALRTFNGLTGKYAVIFIESSNILIGTSKTDENGDAGLAGIPLEDIYTRPWSPSDGSNTATYATQFTFKPVYINENIAFKKVSTSSLLLSELTGLEDVVLELVGIEDDVAAVRADTDCGSTDIYDLYADELANPEAWVVKDADGEIKEIDSVQKNDGPKNWTIELATTDFEDGDTIQLAAPSVLAQTPMSVNGYESNVLTVTLGS